MRIRHGWIYREPANGSTPARIRVKLTENLMGKAPKAEVKVFDDNHLGANAAAEYISSKVGDSWKLEDCAFLGCRIFTEI